MRIRLFAILVMITAGSMILARFNAANEQTGTRPVANDESLVSANRLKTDQWYAARIRNGVAGISVPKASHHQVLEIVVTTVAGDLQETLVGFEKSANNNTDVARYAPIDRVNCRLELKAERDFHFLKDDSPVLVSDVDASAMRRDFKIPLMSPDGNLGQKTTINAIPIVRTEQVEVLVDDLVKDQKSTIALAVRIAGCLERRILPVLNQKVGTALDVDGNGRLSVVLSPKVPGFTKGKQRVKGFVLPDDMIPIRERANQSESNAADVIFLDCCLPLGDALVALLAHEFTHVASLSNACRNKCELPAMWINEAIAHVGERFCSNDNSNIRHRLTAFYQTPHATPMLLDEESFDHLHRDPAVRGASFSFLDWCVRSTNDGLIRELTVHPGETVSVLETTMGLPFEEIVQQWGLSLVESDRPAFLEFPANKEPMTLNVTGSGNLFLRSASHSIRIRVSQDSQTRIAFRITGEK